MNLEIKYKGKVIQPIILATFPSKVATKSETPII